MKIYVIGTDVSKFKETGFGSIESCRSFYESIEDKYGSVKFIVIESMDQINEVIQEKPDLVVCGFKYYIDDEDNKHWMSELMEKNGINFLGSTKASIKYDSDKVSAKDLLRENNVNTPKFFVINASQLSQQSVSDINYPLFVKPVDAACSFGVDGNSLVTNYNELEEKVKQIENEFMQDSLVEEFLPGNEYTVGIIGNGIDLLVEPIELKSPYNKLGYKFLPRETKVDNLETHNCILDINLKAEIISLAKQAYEVLGARDLARIDIKLDPNNKPSFLEINMLPGFSKGRSYFPIAFQKNLDMSYDKTVNTAVNAAIKRIRKQI